MYRTAALAFVMGAMYADQAPSFAIGGFLSHHFGPRVTCFISVLLLLITFLYALTPLVPESFGDDKRAAAQTERLERARNARERSLERWARAESAGDELRGVKRVGRKSVQGVLAVFEPLLRLGPQKREDGKPGRNWRLFTVGAAYSVAALGARYANPAIISWITFVLQHDPQEVSPRCKGEKRKEKMLIVCYWE